MGCLARGRALDWRTPTPLAITFIISDTDTNEWQSGLTIVTL